MMPRLHKSTKAGFSLLELLLAVALGGLLLTAISFQIVSLSNIWLNRADDDFFTEHANGVASFITASFDRASAPPAQAFSGQTDLSDDDSPEGEQQTPEQPESEEQGGNQTGRNQQNGSQDTTSNSQQNVRAGIQLTRPPGFAEIKEPLIGFRQSEPPPLLFERNATAMPTVEAWLYFESGRGLALLWRSPLLEDNSFREEDSLRSTLISPYVTEVLYCYYDDSTESWDEYRDIREIDGEYRLPEFIKLKFVYEEQEVTRLIFVPKATATAPQF